MLQAFSNWENLSVVMLSLVLRTRGFVCPVICDSFCKCFHLFFFLNLRMSFFPVHMRKGLIKCMEHPTILSAKNVSFIR